MLEKEPRDDVTHRLAAIRFGSCSARGGCEAIFDEVATKTHEHK
jgi:hypothetical protein